MSRFLAVVGFVVSVFLFVLHWAKNAADFFAIIHLPHDIQGVLVNAADMPFLIPYTALAICLFCVAYLLIDLIQPKWWKALRPKKPRKRKPKAAAAANESPPVVAAPATPIAPAQPWFVVPTLAALVVVVLSMVGFVGWTSLKTIDHAAVAPRKHRDAVRSQLMQFYAESDPLLSSGWVKTEADLEKYKGDIAAWRLRTRTWIAANMAVGAASFFEDTAPYITQGVVGYPWTMNMHHNWEVNYIGYLRRNLAKLIESDNWDKP